VLRNGYRLTIPYSYDTTDFTAIGNWNWKLQIYAMATKSHQSSYAMTKNDYPFALKQTMEYMPIYKIIISNSEKHSLITIFIVSLSAIPREPISIL